MSSETNAFDAAPGGGKPLSELDFKGKVKTTLLRREVMFGAAVFLLLVLGVTFFNVSQMDDGTPAAVDQVEDEQKEATAAVAPKDDNTPDRGVPGVNAAAAAAVNGATGANGVAVGPNSVDEAARNAVVAETASPHPGSSVTGTPVGSAPVAVASAGMPGTPKVKSAAELQREARAALLVQAASAPIGGAAGSAGGLMPANGNTSGGMMPASGSPPASSTAAGGGDDPNLQRRKEAFLQQQAGSNAALQPNYLAATRQPALSPYEIKAGSVLPAVMVGGLNSDLPGQIKAQLRENVYDTATGRHLLIPAWSMLVGTYDSQVAFGQERVLAVWQRIQFPDGSEMPIGGMPGADQAGNAGMDGEVNNHYVRALGGAVLVSMIAAGMQLATPQQQVTQSGTAAPTVSQTLTQQLGQQIGGLGNTIAGKMLQVQPTIKIPPGTRFNVMVSKNLVLPKPWQWR